MTDDRNDRQRKADEALDSAVREAQAAHAEDDTDAAAAGLNLVSEWVVTGTVISGDPGSDAETSFLLLPDGGGHTTRSSLVGMVRCAQLLVEDGQ